MDNLPHSLLLDILSRLDDSADVARCRVASKAFNTVFPGLRSINLRCSEEWYYSRSSTSNQRITDLNTVFLHLVSKLEVVESMCLVSSRWFSPDKADFTPTEGDFPNKWLPRVSGSLKSLSISDSSSPGLSNLLVLISASCHNLVNLELKLKSGLFFVDSLNPMPMLTSLTLEYLYLKDEHLNKLNKCFPNLQFLKLVGVEGLEDPEIHLLNLKTCILVQHYAYMPYLTIIAPNLITLTLECANTGAIRIEAPMLSHFRFTAFCHADALMLKKFKNLKSLWLDPDDICPLPSELPITKTVDTLTLDLIKKPLIQHRDPEFTLGKLFMVFPNLSSLCIRSGPWSELESSLNPEVWEILDGRKRLKTVCAYLMLVGPSLTFSYVARVVEQCVSLSNVSLLVHSDVTSHMYESFRSKCMARWPCLKWRWGIWNEHREDSWISDGSSVKQHKLSKMRRHMR